MGASTPLSEVVGTTVRNLGNVRLELSHALNSLANGANIAFEGRELRCDTLREEHLCSSEV